jgi:TolB-like protein/DNA-binding winged helix-turn-helix (wHTH) protein
VNDRTAVKIGDWTVRPSANLLERDGASLRIEPRAMDVLMVLASHAGQVVSVDELLAAVWRGVVVTDSSVYLAINQLRHALDAPNGASHIETIPKRGYRLTRPVEPVAQAEPAPAAPPRRSTTARWVAAAALGALVAAGAALLLRGGRPAGPEPRAVAVLPFATLSSDPEQEYFAGGIADEVARSLSRIRGLRVTGRASSSYFRGKDVELAAIGKTLGVGYVVTGSVRRSGAQIRVAAQLSDASTGYQLWSDNYDSTAADVFATQDTIAKSVAEALQVTLGVGDVARMPGMTRNVDAYDAYLRGFDYYLAMRPGTAPLAIEHLQRAVALDPSYSLAWVKLHSAYVAGAALSPSRADEWRERAAAALERAQALTPDAPEVLLEAALAAANRGNWLEAGAIFERVLAAYAEYEMADQPRGAFLLSVGRVREAIGPLERARAAEPLAVAFAYFLADAYFASGDYAATLAEVDRGIALGGLEPALLQTGLMAALAAGDRPEVERRLAAFAGDVPGAALNRAAARYLDEPSAAPAALRALAAPIAPTERIPLMQWAAYYGDTGLVLELLEQTPPLVTFASMLWRDSFRDLRREEGFKERVRATGLVAYWRAYGWPDYCRPADDDFVCD